MKQGFRTSRIVAGRACGTAGVVALLVLAGGPAVPAKAQGTKLPSAEKILDKTIKAQGGRQAFEMLHSRVSTGTFEIVGQRQKGRRTLHESSPDTRYLELQLRPGQTLKTGTDGFVHWEIAINGEAKILEGDEKTISARRGRFNAQLHWRDLYEKVECVGKESLDGRACYKVRLTPKVGGEITTYYDSKTGLPTRKDEVRENESGELLIEDLLSDYRKVDGVMLPHKITRHVRGGPRTATYITIWESIEHNTDMPSDRFELPDKVKQLKK